MPGIYPIDATDITRPNINDEIQYVAAEITALKAYLQSQLSAFGVALSSDYNRVLNNLVINGSFNLAGPAATTPDLWKIQSVGTVVTPSIIPVTFGTATPLLDYPMQYMNLAFTLDSGVASYAYMEQRIESVATLANNSVAGSIGTLSFLAKSTVDGISLSTNCTQNFGTGGTPSAESGATAGITKIPLTTSWTKYTVPIIPNSLVGKAVGTNLNDYLSLRFWLSAGTNFAAATNSLGAQSGTISIANVQLVPGNISTPFQFRTPSQELSLADRYIQRYGGLATQVAIANLIAGNGTGLLLRGIVPLRNRMRAAPAVTIGGNTSTDYTYVGQGYAGPVAGSINATASDAQSYSITSIPSAAVIVGRNYLLYTGNTNALITANSTL